MESAVAYELRGPVAWVGLDRPAKRNVVCAAVLPTSRPPSGAQGEARATVLFGNGPCSCAGLDLSEHRTRSAEETFLVSRSWHAVFAQIRHGRVPAITALHGATVGGAHATPRPAWRLAQSWADRACAGEHHPEAEGQPSPSRREHGPGPEQG